MSVKKTNKIGPIISRGNKSHVKVLVCISVVLFISLVLWAIIDPRINIVSLSTICILGSLLAFIAVCVNIAYNFRIKIYSDRIEKRGIFNKIVYFEEIRRVHCSGWSAQKGQVYTKDDLIFPALTIIKALEDWELLVATLLALIPEEVEVTGSDKLLAGLRKIQQQHDL